MRNKPVPGGVRSFLRTRRGDEGRRLLVSTSLSCVCTALFALYHGYLGLGYRSVWHGSIGLFYLLLMAIRGSILLTEGQNRAHTEEAQHRRRRRTFLLSSALLLVLDLALSLPISLMAVLAKPVRMGQIPSITMASYTTWKLTMACVHAGRQHRMAGGSLLLADLRTVNLIDALVAILTLQNTLIMVNGTADSLSDMLPLCAVSSAVVYVSILVITLRMLWKGFRQTQI